MLPSVMHLPTYPLWIWMCVYVSLPVQVHTSFLLCKPTICCSACTRLWIYPHLPLSLSLWLCAWVVWQWRGAVLECGLCVLFVKINHLDKDIHGEFILNSWESTASERSGDGLWCNGPHHETGRWRESENMKVRLWLPIHIFSLVS